MVASALPTTGLVPDYDFEDDVEAINQVLGPILDVASGVVIVAHCSGTLLASRCPEGESWRRGHNADCRVVSTLGIC